MTIRTNLKLGDQSKEVGELQRACTEAGYPITRTGKFDENTRKVILQFQRSHNLVADGVVGPKTWSVLESLRNATLKCGPTQIELSTVWKMCPQAPRNNIRLYLPDILKELSKRKLTTTSMIHMAIATAYVETGVFAPISEFQSRYNTSEGGQPFDRYDSRRDLGNEGPPDGERYRGRGFIQLTGKNNYSRYGQILGVDLLSQPELANTPAVAASVLCEFLKAHEAQIANALKTGDLALARKVINGGSNGLDVFVQSYGAGNPTKPDSRQPKA